MPEVQQQQKRRTRYVLPAVMMRAGTSRGLFLHRRDLPGQTMDDWKPALLAAMGSSLGDPRQIDGVGGATSTTSKVAVVGPSSIPGVDVDYTFAQVAVGKDVIDFNGSCGNMAAGVGPFAVQEGLVRPKPGQRTMDVRVYNTNTKRVMVETVELTESGDFEEDGDFVIAGAKGSGSEVKVAFVDPAGSMTDKLFPSGDEQRVEDVMVDEADSGLPSFTVEATLIDCANPCVLVNFNSLPDHVRPLKADSETYMTYMEAIRRAGAVRMGLAPTWEAAGGSRGTPKIMVIHAAQDPSQTIMVQAFSMGKPHPTLQMTGAVCIASAVCIPGTVPAAAAAAAAAKSNFSRMSYGIPTPERTPSPASMVDDGKTRGNAASSKPTTVRRMVHVGHPTGVVSVEAVVEFDAEGRARVDRGVVSRTARRIFEGNILYYA
ncbi:methylitaconate delta2-delta3-isomerase [Magnaporthiopsis poae ATCC 64411]|uniref:Methylitaconate delta2-delta3-isomerase n=1 Tax=Magnaporthiopsis poae (strain ATCC 64411 / 73-15) TaxID=644358 RepID=A0A0C4DKI2_MAGP6|nr:methylitaconate delta2-delta3-isomerase [Magnaporthiopsis poae ATCC 64411]